MSAPLETIPEAPAQPGPFRLVGPAILSVLSGLLWAAAFAVGLVAHEAGELAARLLSLSACVASVGTYFGLRRLAAVTGARSLGSAALGAFGALWLWHLYGVLLPGVGESVWGFLALTFAFGALLFSLAAIVHKRPGQSHVAALGGGWVGVGWLGPALILVTRGVTMMTAAGGVAAQEGLLVLLWAIYAGAIVASAWTAGMGVWLGAELTEARPRAVPAGVVLVLGNLALAGLGVWLFWALGAALYSGGPEAVATALTAPARWVDLAALALQALAALALVHYFAGAVVEPVAAPPVVPEETPAPAEDERHKGDKPLPPEPPLGTDYLETCPACAHEFKIEHDFCRKCGRLNFGQFYFGCALTAALGALGGGGLYYLSGGFWWYAACVSLALGGIALIGTLGAFFEAWGKRDEWRKKKAQAADVGPVRSAPEEKSEHVREA